MNFSGMSQFNPQTVIFHFNVRQSCWGYSGFAEAYNPHQSWEKLFADITTTVLFVLLQWRYHSAFSNVFIQNVNRGLLICLGGAPMFTPPPPPPSPWTLGTSLLNFSSFSCSLPKQAALCRWKKKLESRLSRVCDSCPIWLTGPHV